MSNLPRLINVTKAVTYHVEQIAHDIANQEEISIDEVTLEQVLREVDRYVEEDFDPSDSYLTYTDEDGRFLHD